MTQPPTPLDDADVEALLRGRVPDERPDLARLGMLLAAARETGASSPAPRSALAALLSAGFDPAAPPAPRDDVPVWGAAPARSVTGGRLRRRAAQLAGLSVAVQLLVFGGVAVAGVTTAAGAGALPEPLQRRVATVISVLTPFTVPDPAPALAPTSDEPTVGTTTKRAPTSEPRVQETASEPVAPAVEPEPVKTKAAVPTAVAVPVPTPTPTPTPTEVPAAEVPTTEPTGTPSPETDPTQEPSGETAAPEEPAPEESTSDDVEAAPGPSDERGQEAEPATSPEPSPEPAA